MMKEKLKSGAKLSFKERVAQASKKEWLKMILMDLLCLFFVLWTGYLPMLLLIFLFFDSYITKYIPWGFWKKSKNKAFKKVMEWVDAIVFALVAVYFINTFFFQNYQIPTSSLEKSLLIGDFLFVSKMSYGSRAPMTPLSFPLAQHTLPILDIKSYIDKPQLDYQRFWGGGKVKRGDIVVFNFPAGDTVALKMQNPDYHNLVLSMGRDSVWNNKGKYGDIVYRPVDRRENFVKRCVGLPGEIIETRNDSVFINRKHIQDAENVQFTYFVQTDGTALSEKDFEELGINNQDKASIGYSLFKENEPNYIIEKDSATLEKVGLKWNNGNVGILYLNVNITNDKVELLKKKLFVLSVVRSNRCYKDLGHISGSRNYPIDYKMNNAPGDFPALWIPKKGMTIKFDGNVDYKVAAYHRCIRNYEHNDFDYRDKKVFINGKQVQEYTFKFDYFFMMGDNRDNSADSRAWGFVPEDHIVGKPIFIWLSLDQDKGWFSGKIRWDRIFTSAAK